MHVGGGKAVAEELGGLVALEKETLHAFGSNGVAQGVRLRTRGGDETGESRIPS